MKTIIRNAALQKTAFFVSLLGSLLGYKNKKKGHRRDPIPC